ncbi:MAG TPA: leucine--tRNA ligase [Usitatibacter sp.]|nr:leucine--tRNA ligase [Usitatibacter sp.]
MESQYHPRSIEPEVQREWAESRAFAAPDASAKPKYFCVSMLPYPSGKLHMGHVRNYTINDALYHFLRMKGMNVLFPMGWDAFGLPAENAAMANKVAPGKWTRENIAYMKKQCQSMGWAIDWSREVATCDPSYYRWNQWFFLRLWEKGIVYKKTGLVNWDPVDMTVLANEQVIDGRGWRTGALVEKREIPMWYMRITQYADELLDSLDGLGWPEQVKQMQRNWIGRSEGIEFTLPYAPETARRMKDDKAGVKVFTTRADTIMGITFAAVAAEHPVATEAAKGNPQLAAFIEECKRGGVQEAELATMEKKGMPTGMYVLHPFTNEKIEVWVGNYVLMSYGEGAVMAVPGHDERDFAFAKKYGLGIKQVIDVEGEPYSTDAWQEWYAAPGRNVQSGKYDGLEQEAAIDAVARDLEALGLGTRRVQYRLRDWGISRQRYWGTPIPMVICPTCGDVPVPDGELPVVLPEDLVPDGSGSPLAKTPSFYQCKCPKCGGDARRDTDTMDTFVDSSWYYMRYTCPDAPTMVDARAQYWMPMDQYIGGIEHAILHLLYARFWTKAMRDLGLIRIDEPFTNLLTQGMVLNHIFSRRTAKGGIEYFAPDEVETIIDAEGHITGAKLKRDGSAIDYDGIGTMSKSKRNGIDPQDMIEKYGADTARFYVMQANPPTDTVLWSDESVEGSFRFLKRLWAMVHAHLEEGRAERYTGGELTTELRELRFKLHRTIEKVADDYGRRLQFNTAIAAVRELLNLYLDMKDRSPVARAVAQEVLEDSVLLLAPIVPHIATALWQALRPGTRLLDQPWPAVDATALVQDSIQLVVQVNGKLRGHVHVPANATREQIEAFALRDETVAKFVAGQKPKKVVVVPGRLVNVVV